LWGSAALLLFAAGCGGGNDTDSKSLSSQPASSQPTICGPTASPPPAAPAGAATSFPGEPPASPETARIDRVVAALKLPANVEVSGRKDIPNDAPDYNDTPDVVRRFKEFGRQTGVFYLLTASGAPRLTLAVSQYAQPEGAKQEMDFGGTTPSADDRINATGIGDNVAAFRVRLGGQGGPTPAIVSFTRGRYYVVVTDTAAALESPPDMVLDVACAVDEQLKANPAP
jgi:hypothetical protein